MIDAFQTKEFVMDTRTVQLEKMKVQKIVQLNVHLSQLQDHLYVLQICQVTIIRLNKYSYFRCVQNINVLMKIDVTLIQIVVMVVMIVAMDLMSKDAVSIK